MANPDVARLARRADEQDETIRALGDTVLDIKETVDQHTVELAAIQRTQDQHSRTLEQHGRTLDQHGRTLDQHTDLLNHHTGLLTEILRRLETR